MRIVIDTNVFVSGIFFTGPPHRILRAWRDGRVRLVYSAAILAEYERVINELEREFPAVNGGPFLGLLRRYGELVRLHHSRQFTCRDPDDVKFIDCLVQSKACCLVTGDKDLLRADLKQPAILTPRQFCDRHLPAR